MKKIAIVHDWLVNIGGAEKVLEGIYEVFPSDIYTLLKDEIALKGTIFENAKIKTSFIQKLPKAKKFYRNYFPLFPLAVEEFDLREYDIVISSSHAVAKGVLTNANQLHICYCHTPVRYAWDLYHQYLNELDIFRKLVAKYFLHKLRIWDVASSNRVDFFIANSKYVANRIKKIYRRKSKVIYPPVNVEKFEVYPQKENFYLTASRLVPYKRIDLIVKAFSKMLDKRLVLIGDGTEMKKIKSLATKNVEILGYQPFEVLKDYMKRAKAFVFAAEEDFGIMPVEAQACGTPVIAYGQGGVLETVINGKTGIFFERQSVDSLIEAIKKFEKIENSFDSYQIRENAEKFSKEKFKKIFKNFVEEKIDMFFNSI